MSVSLEELHATSTFTKPANEGPPAAKERVSDASVHLDAVRGLAALIVFLGHGQGLFLRSGLREALGGGPVLAQPVTAATSAPPLPAAKHETMGHEAVIVFFVLSGYFVGGSALRAARKGRFSWQKYLFQRLTRLWVVLVPALLLGWALDAGGLHLLQSHQNIYHAPAGQEYMLPGMEGRITPTTFLGNLFFLQGILTPLLGTNDSLWSLSYEFWYYIFFPLLATMLLSSKRASRRIFAGVSLLGLFALCGWQISEYFVIWLFGVAVALLPSVSLSSSRRLITALGLLLFVSAWFLVRRSTLDLYLCDLLLGTAFSALLWVILHVQQIRAASAYRTVAQGLSNMSYTLYLVHMPCFALLSALLMPIWHKQPLSLRSGLMMLGIYAVVFAVAWLMYYCFERNTDKVRDRLSAPQNSSRNAAG